MTERFKQGQGQAEGLGQTGEDLTETRSLDSQQLNQQQPPGH